MPWQHCGAPEIPDTEPCPTCQIGKAQWTLEFNVTRQFTVRRKGALRLGLLDGQGRPVAGEPYRVVLPGGEALEGRLDELGQASHPVASGDCTITFPGRAAGGVVPYVDPDEPAPAGEATPAPRPGEGPASFVRPAGRRHRFQLRNPRWSRARCRFDEAVEMIYEVPGAEDGALVELEVFEHDADGGHDPVACILTQVRGGVARLGWHLPRVEDSDDAPTELDREAGFALPEFFFVARHGASEERCEQLLTFSTDLELPLEDGAGNRLASTAYVLRSHGQARRGTTDAQGMLRERGVGPDFVIVVGDEGERHGRVVAIVGGAPAGEGGRA